MIVIIFVIFYLRLNRPIGQVAAGYDDVGVLAANREAVGVYRRLAQENSEVDPVCETAGAAS